MTLDAEKRPRALADQEEVGAVPERGRGRERVAQRRDWSLDRRAPRQRDGDRAADRQQGQRGDEQAARPLAEQEPGGDRDHYRRHIGQHGGVGDGGEPQAVVPEAEVQREEDARRQGPAVGTRSFPRRARAGRNASTASRGVANSRRQKPPAAGPVSVSRARMGAKPDDGAPNSRASRGRRSVRKPSSRGGVPASSPMARARVESRAVALRIAATVGAQQQAVVAVDRLGRSSNV
jgi:hypothetical protein